MTSAAIVDTAPADCWEDAFPVGNGRHGALVFGRPGAERVIVSHHQLAWPDVAAPADPPGGAGPPGAPGSPGAPGAPGPPAPPDLAGRLEEVRDLLLAGKSRRALELFTGDWPHHHPRPFHPAFALTVRDDPPPARGALPDGYRRSLHYRTGVAVSSWPGRRHTCFASRVRDIVVQRFSGRPGDLIVEVDVRLPGAPPGLRVAGQVHERAAGDALIVTTVEYPGPGQGGYVGTIRGVANPGDGLAVIGRRGIRLAGCRELTLLTRVEPFRDAAELGAARGRGLAAVTGAPVQARRRLLAEHARQHAASFGEVVLDLGVPAAERALSVGELLARQAAQPDEPLPALLEKLFHSGRYLLLSASGSLPPRLTGLWQGDWNAAWSGAITCDANLGLQLAGAVTADVPAAVTAVADLVRDRLADWRENARRIFGTRGFAAPAHSDGLSGLCTHFETRYPLQMWTAAADWLLVPLLDASHAWGDSTFFAERVRPALRELALFYEDFLTRVDADGHVIFVPSYSPENQPGGWSPAAVNASMDIAAARHALTAAASADDLTAPPSGHQGPASTADPGDASRWRDLARRLPPYRVNADGALAEWAWPPAGSGLPPLPDNYEHRHVSHLYPVWPLHDITVTGTPRLAAAALRALRLRGTQDDSAHGYLHKALAAARLRDADLAGRLLAALLGQGFFFRSLMSSHYPKRSVYNADAACALPGVLIEMLVDSVPGTVARGRLGRPGRPGRPGRVELLPAVPDFLPAGRLRGGRTLAGVLVADLRWNTEAGDAEAVLISRAGQQVDVGCWQAPAQRVTLPAGQPVRMTWNRDE
jgi:alpha-L-fucosidase 2